MSVKHHRALTLVIALLVAPIADAHPLAAHAAAWQAFMHPFSGLDHVSAMLVIGLWAGLTSSRRRLLPPLSFIVGLMVGAALGAYHPTLPAMEIAIALTVLLLGPLAARDARLPVLACLVAGAAAGLVHGYAHGVELSGQGLAGAAFVLGSVLLHAVGYVLARRVADSGNAVALRRALSASGVLGLGLLWMA